MIKVQLPLAAVGTKWLLPTQETMYVVFETNVFLVSCLLLASPTGGLLQVCQPIFDLPLYVNPSDPTPSSTYKAYWQKPSMMSCPGFSYGQFGLSGCCKPNQKSTKATLPKVKAQGNKEFTFRSI